MRTAVLDASGLVVNVIVTDGPADKIEGFTLVESEVANIGDSCVDGVIVKRVEPASIPAMTIYELRAFQARFK